MNHFKAIATYLVAAAMLCACSAQEVGQSSYNSAKKWCSQTNDHCTVNND